MGDASGDGLTLFTFSSNQKTLPRYLPVQKKYLLFLDIAVSLAHINCRQGERHSVHYLLKRLSIIVVPG